MTMGFLQKLGNVVKTVGNVASKVADIAKTVTSTISKVKETFTKVSDGIKGLLDKLPSNKLFDGIKDFANKFLGKADNFLNGPIISALDSFVNKVGTSADKISNFVNAIDSKIPGGLAGLEENAKNNIANLIAAAQAKLFQ